MRPHGLVWVTGQGAGAGVEELGPFKLTLEWSVKGVSPHVLVGLVWITDALAPRPLGTGGTGYSILIWTFVKFKLISKDYHQNNTRLF